MAGFTGILWDDVAGGEVADPDQYNELGQAVEALDVQVGSLTTPGWIPYTPVWSASGTAVALGNGTNVAEYRRSSTSDLIIARGKLTMGSATTYGTGYYKNTLPVVATASDLLFGGGTILDSGTIERPISCRYESTTDLVWVSDGGAVAQTVPHTWAVNDSVTWWAMYKPAA